MRSEIESKMRKLSERLLHMDITSEKITWCRNDRTA